MSSTVIAVVICAIFVALSTYINQRKLEKIEYRCNELKEATNTLTHLGHELSIDYFTVLDIALEYMSPEELNEEFKVRRKYIAKQYYKDTEEYIKKIQDKF